jgi:hypothetical protein
MSIKAYSSIVENISSSNYLDIYDETLNKIRFTIRNQELYITSYDPTENVWYPATVNFENAPNQNTSVIDYQDILNSNNVRIQLDATIPVNGKEVLIFENIGNYNTIKRSGLNYDIDSSPYKPTVNLDDRAVIYQIDGNGNPRLTLSNISLNNLSQNFVTLADAQTITGIKTFNANKFLLGGNGGNITLNASQAANSSSYTLEYPTAAPSGILNVLTTSGSSPYSKLTWTDLNATYAALSTFDQLSALNTTGSPSFSNLSISSGGALNLNYMSTPASSDIIATLNVNKQLTNSGVSLSDLATLGTAQTFSADKTFNYSAGKIKLSNYTTDNTETNNFLIVNSSGYVVPCNKVYSDMMDLSSAQTISGNKTFSGTTTLSGVNADTATSSGQKLAVLNTTSNAVERVNITPDNLATLSGAQTISGAKTFSGIPTFTNGIVNELDWVKEHMFIMGSGSNPWGALVKWIYTATSNVPYLYWWSSIIVPYKSATLNIPCPISGTIILYNLSTTATTTTCNANGINYGALAQISYLYYVIDPTNLSAAYSQDNFRLIIGPQARRELMANGTIDPNSWILIASQNYQYELIFKPMNVILYVDETRYSNGSGDVITGNKTFNGTTRTLSLENPGNTAQKTLNYSGYVYFDSSGFLRWTSDILAICTDSSFLPTGATRITCPTSGTITYFKSDNTTTTVTCTSSGIPILTGTWSALYYRISNGMSASSNAANFVLADYGNTVFRVNDNWLLIAVVNKDNGNQLKWIPTSASLYQGSYFSSYLSQTNREHGTYSVSSYQGTRILNFNGPPGRYMAKSYAYNGNSVISEATAFFYKVDSSTYQNVSHRIDQVYNGGGGYITDGTPFGHGTNVLYAFNNTNITPIVIRVFYKLLIF